MKTSTPAVRSVTLKATSTKIHMFPTPSCDEPVQRLRDMISNLDDPVGGYALVVWDKQGRALHSADTDNGPITSNMLPEFLKTNSQRLNAWRDTGSMFE
jgi:hypothetical protein